MVSAIKNAKNILKNIDASVFISSSEKPDPNLIYFLGIPVEYGVLVIQKSKKPVILVPNMEFSRIKKLSPIKVVKLKKLFPQLSAALRNCKVIGINKDIVSINEYKKLKKNLGKKSFKDISRLCSGIRAVKSSQELGLIKKACSISDIILKKCIAHISRSQTESGVAAFLLDEARKLGCQPAFEPIVASGRNSSFPHHAPQNKKLQKGFCIIDFGVKYKGYCADVSRTVYIGKPSVKDKKVYNALLELQKSCISKCSPGTKASELYNYAQHKIGKSFTHGLGHGVGVAIHESPSLGPKSKDILKEGMVLTIEPGTYLKNYGIRIEDTVIIKKNKPEVLTKIPKKLFIA